jgi:hypothetical protein
MPANLTPQYLAAEEKFRKASTPEEKLEALHEMMATIPKHKGTEKLRAEIKQKISKLKKEVSSSKKRKASSYNPGVIEKEGAGQVAVIGPPNTGKSSFIHHFTNAHVHITDFAFGTVKPVAGMMKYEDIQFQLIDTPPLFSQYHESYFLDLIHRADLIIIFLSPEDLVVDELNFILDWLEEHKIRIHEKNKDEFDGHFIYKNAFFIMNKVELDSDQFYFQLFKEMVEGLSQFYTISIKENIHLDQPGKWIFKKLDIVRVYSKEPGKKPDLEEPFVLPAGSTVMDLAGKIHKDMVKFKYARLWGHGKFDGQNVPRDYVIQDKDIIEIHI